jgi:hypothetical protein
VGGVSGSSTGFKIPSITSNGTTIGVILVLSKHPCPNYLAELDTHTLFGFHVIFGMSPKELPNWTPGPDLDKYRQPHLWYCGCC